MDVTLDQHTLKWRDIAREFAQTVVRPASAELDAQPDPEDSWSWTR